MLNGLVQWIARRFGFVVVLEKLPKQLTPAMEGSKLDYQYLDHVMDLISRLTTISPQIFFEVGANYAQDAVYLAEKWDIPAQNVYIFEPHPVIATAVAGHYQFEVNQKAVSNLNGLLTFNAVNIDETSNSGISSLLKHRVNDFESVSEVVVEVIRLDDFVKAQGISKIDFLKIDVEGMTFEVLDGLGEFIHKVACIQIETEVLPIWENQHTQTDVYKLLESKGFQLIEHITQMDGIQGGSLWARSDVVTHKIYDMVRREWVVQP